MAIEVAKVELKTVQDASGLETCIKNGQFTADQVVGVIGKTEGNGGVNDFTRILADQAFRRTLMKHGRRSEQEVGQIPMVWSGGCDGVITPHATIFARTDATGPMSQSRLAIGTAMSVELLPEDIGRPAMVEKVADAVKAAMRDAGIMDAADVHYVQTKTPLLTVESVRDAAARGAVEVAAYDRNNTRLLSTGTLTTIDNLIDPTTATFRLKATFKNDDEKLWPGEFVNARLLVDTRKDVVVIPPLAVQRGPRGLFAWVVKADGTVEPRPIQTSATTGDRTIVSSGVNDGDRVVTDGQYKLQTNAPVTITAPSTAATPGNAS